MDQIDKVLTRGVEKIYPSKEKLDEVLKSGKKIRLFQGFDPTGDKMHIGHMIGLRKLRQFQDLGHHVIFLIGDGTGQAGDPSGKTQTRKKDHSLTLSTSEDKPGVLRRLAESFEKEGISIEAIESQRTGGNVSFKIGVDEKKYSPELITKVVRSLGSQGFFTSSELRENAKGYVKQASKIVRFDGENPAEIVYNGDWLNKLSYEDVLNIAGHFSLQQLSERDLFQERLKRGEEVNLREFLYPLFQAYDSVVLNVDLEIGGSDQTFNMLLGRNLAKDMLGKEKFVLTTPLLTDAKGVKIGKTEGNVIALTDPPSQLYGEIMSLSDDIIVKALEYLTDIPAEEIEKIEKAIKDGHNPLEYKKKLALEIVAQLNSKDQAQKAQSEFENTFQKGQAPANIPPIILERSFVSNATVTEGILESGFANSKSQAKRLVQAGSVDINDQTVTNPNANLGDYFGTGEATVKIGKKNFGRLKLEDKDQE